MPADPVIDTETAARLRGVVMRLSRQFNRIATLAGLTPSQATALGVVVHRGPLALSELTRIEGLNPTMMSRVVGRLDELGLIRRSVDPDDQRAAVVGATDLGRETSTRMAAERAAALAGALDGMPGRDRTAILQALPALEALAEELGRRAG
jgi:DNA-binding MarR family transcriptional regulator